MTKLNTKPSITNKNELDNSKLEYMESIRILENHRLDLERRLAYAEENHLLSSANYFSQIEAICQSLDNLTTELDKKIVQRAYYEEKLEINQKTLQERTFQLEHVNAHLKSSEETISKLVEAKAAAETHKQQAEKDNSRLRQVIEGANEKRRELEANLAANVNI
jgi:septal ring factor EnvC (AmiA/AmiB activator)